MATLWHRSPRARGPRRRRTECAGGTSRPMMEHPRTQRRGATAWRGALEGGAVLATGATGGLLVGGWGAAMAAVGAAGTVGTTVSGTVAPSSHDGGDLH